MPIHMDSLPIPSDIEKLTQAEIKLLSVLADPKNRFLTVTEIAELAGIHRDTYYRSFKKPYFIEASNQLALAMIKSAAVPLVHAGLDAAMQGSFHHWKVLMEMGQLYDPKRMLLEANEEEGTLTVVFSAPKRENSDRPRLIESSPAGPGNVQNGKNGHFDALPFSDLDDPE